LVLEMEPGLCPVFFLRKILGLRVVFSLKRGSEIRTCASIDSYNFLSKFEKFITSHK
jgi:hypothetical protein